MRTIILLFLLIISFSFVSCRGEEEELITSTQQTVEEPEFAASYSRLYVLNEGNMGMNKASLDFLDYTTGVYNKHTFTEVNPKVTLELGDVGNALFQYGSKLYIALTNSNLIEVVDAYTLKHISSIMLPLCRQFVAYEGTIYATAFSGSYDKETTVQQGCVVAIDTTQLTITKRLIVGREPEGLSVCNHRLYIALSGGYHKPNYDHRLAVVKLEDFTLERFINVGLNPMLVKTLNSRTIAVATLGDHDKLKGKVYFVDPSTHLLRDSINAMLHSWWYNDDNLYCLESSLDESIADEAQLFSYNVNDHTLKSYPKINEVLKEMQHPYGLAIHPETQNIYITDARDYLSPGVLYCFTIKGVERWKVTTGDIPGHFSFAK